MRIRSTSRWRRDGCAWSQRGAGDSEGLAGFGLVELFQKFTGRQHNHFAVAPCDDVLTKLVMDLESVARGFLHCLIDGPPATHRLAEGHRGMFPVNVLRHTLPPVYSTGLDRRSQDPDCIGR